MVQNRAAPPPDKQEAIEWTAVNWNELVPRLLLFAKRRISRTPGAHLSGSEEDLVAGAIEKTISHRRPWSPERVGLFEHLCGVISSDTYNLVRKRYKEPSSDEIVEQILQETPSRDPDPEQALIARSTLSKFIEYLKRKDERSYKWFLLSSVYSLPREDVERTMNMDPGETMNIRRRVRRAAETFMSESSADT